MDFRDRVRAAARIACGDDENATCWIAADDAEKARQDVVIIHLRVDDDLMGQYALPQAQLQNAGKDEIIKYVEDCIADLRGSGGRYGRDPNETLPRIRLVGGQFWGEGFEKRGS